MVAKEVTLTTKAAGSDKAYSWNETCDGMYTIEETEKDGRGTVITLKLKDEKELNQNFTEKWTIRNIIKKHFLSHCCGCGKRRDGER